MAAVLPCRDAQIPIVRTLPCDGHEIVSTVFVVLVAEAKRSSTICWDGHRDMTEPLLPCDGRALEERLSENSVDRAASGGELFLFLCLPPLHRIILNGSRRSFAVNLSRHLRGGKGDSNSSDDGGRERERMRRLLFLCHPNERVIYFRSSKILRGRIGSGDRERSLAFLSPSARGAAMGERDRALLSASSGNGRVPRGMAMPLAAA
jgi:hypothetical protein